jgi:hypothetical protein
LQNVELAPPPVIARADAPAAASRESVLTPKASKITPDVALGGMAYGAIWGRKTSILAAIALGLSFLLPKGGDLGVSLCYFKRWTDLPCPGCGLTRCFTCISHGRFHDAFNFHPMGPLVYAIAVASALGLVIGAERRMRLARWFSLHERGARLVYWGFIGSFIAFGLVRLLVVWLFPGHVFSNV